MTAQELQLVDLILRTGASVAGNDPLALLQEGFVKVGILRALLNHGCKVREGSSRTEADWLLAMTGKEMQAQLVPRTRSSKAKLDIRIEKPMQLYVELKVYGEVGSKDNFHRSPLRDSTGSERSSNSFLWDLECVRIKNADMAVVVSSARNYDTARGERWDTRGGPNATLLLDQLLPERRSLRLDEITEHQGILDGLSWRVRGLLAAPPESREYDLQAEPRPKPEERVVLALWPETDISRGKEPAPA
jgi:hypothetical protein